MGGISGISHKDREKNFAMIDKIKKANDKIKRRNNG